VRIGGSENELLQELAGRTAGVPVHDPEALQPALAQLAEYLLGRRTEFDLAIDDSMLTDFQRLVLGLVGAIPYGRVRTYGDIALELGKPGASRAVGRANATNPIPLVIPCHRVIGSDGKLHGYGGGDGIVTKAWLLRHEGSLLL
jgi:methylated-DNA-[protein]-cysteine S-methyltransferase